ncbi:hypothetical protein ACFUTY_32500 [Streptomyces sp. NPDC057362]|uniref:hypothetical protein n=1 Tax=Streptomyces sp. NPDC057362 TaxID=3346106 RepID=UPI0036421185
MERERRIGFPRERQMLCGICRHRWVVDRDWINLWEQAKEVCTGCCTTCEHQDSPRETVAPDDPVLDDDKATRFSWYHTRTEPYWPARSIDPTAPLTAETCMRIGGDQGSPSGTRARRVVSTAGCSIPGHVAVATSETVAGAGR